MGDMMKSRSRVVAVLAACLLVAAGCTADDAVRLSAKARTARLSFESASDHAARFAVLADPERLRLLHALAVEPDGLTSGVIADVLGLAPASVEEHVEVLASAGLVTRGPEGFVQVAREGRWAFPNPDRKSVRE